LLTNQHVHVCAVFAFELSGDLETGGWSHSRSSKLPPFSSSGTVSYSSSIVTVAIACTICKIRLQTVRWPWNWGLGSLKVIISVTIR